MPATVISICPFPINEFKPGLFPDTYRLPAVAEGDIEVLIIPDTIYARFRVPIVGNTINVPQPAEQVAKSIVEDRMTGQLLYSEDAKPGLFWVPGAYTKEEVKTRFSDSIKTARDIQKKWYVNIVALADDDWNKTHQHRFISDLQRHAARVLKIERDWLVVDISDASNEKNCLACYAPMHPKAVICPTCRTNQAEFVSKVDEKKK